MPLPATDHSITSLQQSVETSSSWLRADGGRDVPMSAPRRRRRHDDDSAARRSLEPPRGARGARASSAHGEDEWLQVTVSLPGVGVDCADE